MVLFVYLFSAPGSGNIDPGKEITSQEVKWVRKMEERGFENDVVTRKHHARNLLKTTLILL